MIEIELFGPTCVSGEEVTLHARDLGGSKPRQVLEILAVELGRPVTKDALADRLWEHSPPRSYIATLESYVCCLRRRLAGLGTDAGVLVTTPGGYLLDEAQVHVDLVEVRELLDRADPTWLYLNRGLGVDVLLADDPYATWANDVRDQLAAARSMAYVQAAHQANVAGDDALAEGFARTALVDRSWSEPAVQELMAALTHEGNHAQALIEYHGLRSAMRDELGVEPSPVTQALYLSILRAEAEAPDDLAVLVGLLKSALEAASGLGRVCSPEMAEVGRMLLGR
jgi:DNA-binding SARP family transcriptional activator